jgi:hypothetical protein
MPYRLCPVCHTPGRLLPDASADAVVDYYRCDTCGRVWTHRKDGSHDPPKLVTTPPEK